MRWILYNECFELLQGYLILCVDGNVPIMGVGVYLLFTGFGLA